MNVVFSFDIHNISYDNVSEVWSDAKLPHKFNFHCVGVVNIVMKIILLKTVKDILLDFE